jgi:hypothetical protein
MRQYFSDFFLLGYSLCIFYCSIYNILMGKSLLRFKSLLVLCIASAGIVLGYQNCGGGGLYVSLNSSGTADLFSQNFVEPFEPVSMFLHTGDKLFLMAAPDSTDVGSGNSSTASAQTKSLTMAQTSSQQSTAYHWFLGDSEVSVPGHFIVLQNIDAKKAGTYSVEYMKDGEKIRRKIAEVVVQEKTNSAELPQIIEQPKILRQGNGKTVLFVSALGSPQPTVQWYQDGQVLSHEKSPYLVLPSESPQGDFYAQFSNASGVVTTGHLTLSNTPVAPRIINLKNVVSYIEGDSVRLFVEVSGFPQPTVKIQKNGVDVVLEMKATLRFPAIHFSDAGDYQIIASNKLGSDTQQVSIGVACQVGFHVEGNVCVSNTKSCVRADNSMGQKYWNGSAYGECLELVCESNTHYDSALKACISNEKSCVAVNGSGVYVWNGSAWGTSCIPRSCFDGYHMDGGSCVSNAQACNLENGVGSKIWDGAKYGECVNPVCNNEYHLENNRCVYNSRECPIKNGVGLQVWNGINFTSCSVISCAPGFEPHDNSCYLACKAGEHFEYDQCKPNTKLCSVTFGSGQSIWNGESYSACGVTNCGAGYRVANDAKSCVKICDAGQHSDDGVTCVADAKICYVDHGRGAQLWTGANYGACVVNDCDDLFRVKDNACVAVVCEPGQVWDRNMKACVAPYVQTYSSGWIGVNGGCSGGGFSVVIKRSVSLTGVGYNYSLDWTMHADYTNGTGTLTFSSGEVRKADYNYGRDAQSIKVVAPVSMNDDLLVYANQCKGGEPDALFLTIKNSDFK